MKKTFGIGMACAMAGVVTVCIMKVVLHVTDAVQAVVTSMIEKIVND